MPIVNSVIVSAVTQIDLRISVVERHIDHLNIQYNHVWLAPAGTDLNTAMAAYALRLVDELRDSEIETNINDIRNNGDQATPSLDYSTGAQNFAVLRAVYQTATRVEAIMMADFLNTLTDQQLQNAFNMTAQQVTNLRNNKLIPASDLADSIRAASGA